MYDKNKMNCYYRWFWFADQKQVRFRSIGAVQSIRDTHSICSERFAATIAVFPTKCIFQSSPTEPPSFCCAKSRTFGPRFAAEQSKFCSVAGQQSAEFSEHSGRFSTAADGRFSATCRSRTVRYELFAAERCVRMERPACFE